MEEDDFELFTAPHNHGPIFMKLEIYNYYLYTTSHATFEGLRRRGWSGKIAS